ncbi:uncharacterized protein LOC127806662 isoform X2 [Diospyros lotus]|uniref:uncharacterized protein LOC127806662 isoform X2 n=1 Tax=Diospyros lotus TaxID=55363 RepID=UPI002255B82F|nr:uncharacterized protein LOC127806662 isoform X2 [Diospyros lotus]
MYVTRLLSRCLRSPEYLSLPPEGPNSGYLVLQDEESETTTCFGLCKDRYMSDLPFPQNKDLTIRYSSGSGKNRHVSLYGIVLIPVLNQPLSSNRYYAMKPHGSHKGLFTATSIAPDGFPPYFMRRKGWEIYTGTPKNYKLAEALGVNNGLRSRLPDFNFPPHYKTSGAIVVGKWYCPFMFIRDGKFKDQMKRSMFYEMTLEQRWEQIFACENDSSQGNAVTVDATVQIETAFIEGREATWDESNQANGVVWFRSFGAGGETTIGLSSLIVYRMRWEQQRAGWTSSGTGFVRVSRTEEFAGSGGWKKYGCYLLVERFVLKRMNGSLSLACDFKHTHVVGSKWE